MSKIPEVFAIFEQKLAHVLSFTVVPLKSKDLKNALEEILTYFSSIVERASKAESRIAELSQAVGLITTMKPTMVMDANHPLDMVREVAEHVTARIAELEAAQRWIPVGERLPEPYTRVLACIKSGYMEVDYMYSEPIVDVGTADFNSLDNVTHWMPLPEPPEVQE